ncbi:GTP cyclohydrolase II [Spiribacter vilamensis]|uniref:GTP cyclohydrolase-2 n=1 Tax=Spiribacter vilamensis TaxID=531306 RepID=A0A4Q8CYT7_9GAMM|nr:GTP cyclohydrolase II [Spiribacter vilamensis]RZU98067.1 GTP cyclohydrolase II [Spiribacter vilamensis]TVO61031.1 GTP cyclohydrolase II [Spiribacter vilamensis]
MQRIRRALIDLRRGEPVHLAHPEGGMLILALENLSEALLARARTLATDDPYLLITRHRAHAVGLENDDDHDLAMALDADEPVETAIRLASDRAAPRTERPGRAADPAEQQALHLARQATLLPALVALGTGRDDTRLDDEIRCGEILSVDIADIRTACIENARQPERISEARVPLAEAEQSRFILYREADGLLEHVALIVGEPDHWPETPALRMHSACLTGDLFGSLRCDCGEQLRSAVGTIAAEGGGVLLYLAQEGRGIGLANKLRAYGLQDTGLDTVDADRLLGFGADERRYEVAAAMLNDLDIHRVRLMTNNPAKIAALERHGIEIAGREALHGAVNRHNERYLTTKAERAGHWLGEAITNAARRQSR